MAKIILVTGGARSGKSTFAERYVARRGEQIAYIATAQIFDEEMRYRVKLHRKRRPESWPTYEAPFGAESTILEAAKQHDTLLFDCLTIYLSNQLCAQGLPELAEERAATVLARMDALIDAARRADGQIVFVTNEVGLGIVPENALAREYRDLAGISNQRFAEVAAEVYLVTSGIPVNIKQLATKEFM